FRPPSVYRAFVATSRQIIEPISKLAAQPDYFVVSSLAPRCTSMYYLGARCGPSRTRAARPILRYVLSRSAIDASSGMRTLGTPDRAERERRAIASSTHRQST